MNATTAAPRPPMNPKVRVALVGTAAVVLVGLVGIIGFVAMERRSIVKDGIRVEATVLDLNEEKIGRKKTRYLLKAGVFTGGGAEARTSTAPAVAKPGQKAIDATLDKLFADSKARMAPGNYTSTTLAISGERFRKLTRGDRVTMAYPAGHPEKIILLNEGE